MTDLALRLGCGIPMNPLGYSTGNARQCFQFSELRGATQRAGVGGAPDMVLSGRVRKLVLVSRRGSLSI